MIEEAVKELVCSVLKIEPEQYSEELAAGDVPGWDSLGHVNLLIAVEKRFSIALDVADSIEIETVGDILDVVKRYKQLS